MVTRFIFSVFILILSSGLLVSSGHADGQIYVDFKAPGLSQPQVFPADLLPEPDRGGSFFLAETTTEITPVGGDEEFFDEFNDDQLPQVTVSDPLYYFNYAMYAVNDVLYLGLIEPIARGYKAITPLSFRKGVRNFFHNLLFPVRFVNNLLQFEINDAGKEVGIFVINTTAGVLGFGQVAQNNFDLHTADEDLGQTFGKYGIGNGFYLVLPVLGPSTLRDAVGGFGDSFLNPLEYVDPWELSLGLRIYDTINSTTFRIGDYKALKEASFDPYAAIRDAYIQRRAKQVKE